MDIILKLIQSPTKDKYGSYGKYDFFTVLMSDDALGAHEKCISPEQYDVQLLKEKLVSEYKVPEEIVERIVKLAEYGAVREYCKNNSDDI